MKLYYLGREMIRGPRRGFYSIENNRKRYWTDKSFEFVIRFPPPEQTVFPDAIWRIIWEFKESFRQVDVNNLIFESQLNSIHCSILKQEKREDELAIDAAIRLFPRSSMARHAKRLLRNF